MLAGSGAFFLHIPVSAVLAENQCNFIGALFLSVLTDRIFVRGAANPPPLHLYLDEYGKFATRAAADLFTQGRKHGVGLTIAHQNRTQIEDPQNRAAELDAAR